MRALPLSIALSALLHNYATTDLQPSNVNTFKDSARIQAAAPHDLFLMQDARRLVLDLYAEREMRRRGIRVLDISGLPANYSDFTHYDIFGNDMQNIVLGDALCPS